MDQDIGRNDAEDGDAGGHIDDEGQGDAAQRGASHVDGRVLDQAGQGRGALDAQEGPEDDGQRGRHRLQQGLVAGAPRGREGVAAEGHGPGDDGQDDGDQTQAQGDGAEAGRRPRSARIGRRRQPDQGQIAERRPQRFLQRGNEEGQIAGARHRQRHIARQAGRPIGQPRLIADEAAHAAPGEVRQAVGVRLHPAQTAEHQGQGHRAQAADQPADDAAAARRRQGRRQKIDARTDHVSGHHQGGERPSDAVRRVAQDFRLGHLRRIDRNVAPVAG
ncbi:hypothetical protein D3C72_1021420 [compost metagenome]